MGNCLKIPNRNNRISSSFGMNGRNSVYGIPEHPRYPPPHPSDHPSVQQAWTESRTQEYIIRELENDKIIRFPKHYGNECCICLETVLIFI